MYELYYLALDSQTDTDIKLIFTITLVDDDPFFIEALRDHLYTMKIRNVETFSTGEDFLAALKPDDKRLVVCDFDFGSAQRMNGMQVLEEIKRRDPNVPVIMLSAQDKLTIALETLRKGAVDYFVKGTETTLTSVFASIMKVNEVARLKKIQPD